MMALNRTFIRLLLAALMALCPLYTVMAEDDDYHDYIEARQLLDAGIILPLETILQNVRQKFPGRVLEVELEKKAGHKIVYEVEILRNDGVIQEVYINATTGDLLYTNGKK